jgi:hypothetical protein
VSRYKLSRSQKAVRVQDFDCGQMRVSGYVNNYKFVLCAEAIKNRDKLIDPTVRVSGWFFNFFMTLESLSFDYCDILDT